MDVLTYSAVLLTGLAAAAIQACTGFGAAMVLMLVLPYFYTMVESPAICQVICTVLAAVMAWRMRKKINLKMMWLPVVLYTASGMAAVLLVGKLNLKVITAAFGVFLILLSIYFLLFEKKIHLKGTTVSAVLCSLFSGVCGGIFGVGGPFIALYLVSVIEDPAEYVAGLQLLFVVSNLFTTFVRIGEGIYHSGLIAVSVAGIVGVLLGQRLGRRIGNKMNAEKTRFAVYICVGVSGLITLLQQLV